MSEVESDVKREVTCGVCGWIVTARESTIKKFTFYSYRWRANVYTCKACRAKAMENTMVMEA